MGSIALIIAWVVIDLPSDNYEVLHGTVEQSFVVMPRYQQSYTKCRVLLNNNVRFEGRCNNFQQGTDVSVYQYRHRVSGLPIYEIVGN